jgi:hypothetical protein
MQYKLLSTPLRSSPFPAFLLHGCDEKKAQEPHKLTSEGIVELFSVLFPTEFSTEETIAQAEILEKSDFTQWFIQGVINSPPNTITLKDALQTLEGYLNHISIETKHTLKFNAYDIMNHLIMTCADYWISQKNIPPLHELLLSIAEIEKDNPHLTSTKIELEAKYCFEATLYSESTTHQFRNQVLHLKQLHQDQDMRERLRLQDEVKEQWSTWVNTAAIAPNFGFSFELTCSAYANHYKLDHTSTPPLQALTPRILKKLRDDLIKITNKTAPKFYSETNSFVYKFPSHERAILLVTKTKIGDAVIVLPIFLLGKNKHGITEYIKLTQNARTPLNTQAQTQLDYPASPTLPQVLRQQVTSTRKSPSLDMTKTKHSEIDTIEHGITITLSDSGFLDDKGQTQTKVPYRKDTIEKLNYPYTQWLSNTTSLWTLTPKTENGLIKTATFTLNDTQIPHVSIKELKAFEESVTVLESHFKDIPETTTRRHEIMRAIVSQIKSPQGQAFLNQVQLAIKEGEAQSKAKDETDIYLTQVDALMKQTITIQNALSKDQLKYSQFQEFQIAYDQFVALPIPTLSTEQIAKIESLQLYTESITSNTWKSLLKLAFKTSSIEELEIAISLYGWSTQHHFQLTLTDLEKKSLTEDAQKMMSPAFYLPAFRCDDTVSDFIFTVLQTKIEPQNTARYLFFGSLCLMLLMAPFLAVLYSIVGMPLPLMQGNQKQSSASTDENSIDIYQGYFNATGTTELANSTSGETYVSRSKNGLPDGRTAIHKPNGEIEIVDFQEGTIVSKNITRLYPTGEIEIGRRDDNDFLEGRCFVKCKDTTTLQGEFSHGIFFSGTFTTPDKTTFTGGFTDMHPDGMVRTQTPEGHILIGNINRGIREGLSISIQPEGVVLAVNYANNEEIISYAMTGPLLRMTQTDGTVVIGRSFRGKLHGVVTATKKNGDAQFLLTQHGFAFPTKVSREELCDGSIIEGPIDENNNFYGICQQTYPDGKVVIGEMSSRVLPNVVLKDDQVTLNTSPETKEKEDVRLNLVTKNCFIGTKHRNGILYGRINSKNQFVPIFSKPS